MTDDQKWLTAGQVDQAELLRRAAAKAERLEREYIDALAALALARETARIWQDRAERAEKELADAEQFQREIALVT